MVTLTVKYHEPDQYQGSKAIRILVGGDSNVGHFAVLLTDFQFDKSKPGYFYNDNANYSGKSALKLTELQVTLNDNSLRILRDFMLKEKIDTVLIDSLSECVNELTSCLNKAGIKSTPEKTLIAAAIGKGIFSTTAAVAVNGGNADSKQPDLGI